MLQIETEVSGLGDNHLINSLHVKSLLLTSKVLVDQLVQFVKTAVCKV